MRCGRPGRRPLTRAPLDALDGVVDRPFGGAKASSVSSGVPRTGPTPSTNIRAMQRIVPVTPDSSAEPPYIASPSQTRGHDRRGDRRRPPSMPRRRDRLRDALQLDGALGSKRTSSPRAPRRSRRSRAPVRPRHARRCARRDRPSFRRRRRPVRITGPVWMPISVGGRPIEGLPYHVERRQDGIARMQKWNIPRHRTIGSVVHDVGPRSPRRARRAPPRRGRRARPMSFGEHRVPGEVDEADRGGRGTRGCRPAMSGATSAWFVECSSSRTRGVVGRSPRSRLPPRR